MFASDFYMDTAGWDPYAVGIYQRLLLYEWVNGGLPNDPIQLMRIAGAKPKKFESNWSKFVSSKFSVNGDEKLTNRRMEEVRKKQVKYLESQSEKGKKGGRPPKSPGFSLALNRQKPKESSSSSSSLLLTKNKGFDEKAENMENPKRWYKNELGNFVCYQCQKSFMNYENLQGHFQSHGK